MPSAADAVLEFRKVAKRYGEQVVLEDFDFALDAGEKVALIGPSGSGKSTVLRIAMTLEDIQAGDVRVHGDYLWRDGRPADRTATQRLRAHLGMVFQHFHLFPHLSVLENLTLAPRLVQSVAAADAEAAARELLERVGLADKADAWPEQLSGGQKQRVAIARALAMQPDIMLFDEVTSALDPEMVGEVLDVLRELGRSTDMSMLLVTHEMDFAYQFADRVVFMDGGRVVEMGPPKQLFDQPREERTQQFLQRVRTR
ncbi:MAG TPA: ectoine/hydroxyectoine ABC transporter ATP-binding protein EhuA [Gammaproteobacteria bacterium]|nr:ectoine/hydroxyectoine ABC transporter ATP-binding protein EhuA [Gammaproteobacteria bacterium]